MRAVSLGDMDDELRLNGPRVSYTDDVVVENKGEATTLSGLDLSAGGLGVWGPAECPSGTFKISLPLSDELGALVVEAKVARQFQSDGGAVWGISFISLSEAAKRRLRAHVAREGTDSPQ